MTRLYHPLLPTATAVRFRERRRSFLWPSEALFLTTRRPGETRRGIGKALLVSRSLLASNESCPCSATVQSCARQHQHIAMDNVMNLAQYRNIIRLHPPSPYSADRTRCRQHRAGHGDHRARDRSARTVKLGRGARAQLCMPNRL
jgi:hypothetical protein